MTASIIYKALFTFSVIYIWTVDNHIKTKYCNRWLLHYIYTMGSGGGGIWWGVSCMATICPILNFQELINVF